MSDSCGACICCLLIAFKTGSFWATSLEPSRSPNNYAVFKMYSIRVLQKFDFPGTLSGTVPFPWHLCLKSTSYKSDDIFFQNGPDRNGNVSRSFLVVFSWNPAIMWCNGTTMTRFVLRSFCGLSFLSFGVGDLQITECFWCSALRVRCHGPSYEICFSGLT